MYSRIIAVLLFILTSPVFVIVSIWIYLEDGGPVFFKQKRIGKGYTFFQIYKFRSMKKETPNVATHLLTNPEFFLLKSGTFLRKLSLDELPNLINIIKGEMVFVGPRPALYNQTDLMELRKKAGIENLKPGITGWAQINGRDEISLEEKVNLEKYYLTNKSLFFDSKIIFLTLFAVFLRKGVKH
ncbi:sugar transferase [Sediminibacterium sp.]|uniref:sugar transferase n=1 Tax=Sediminibacterium sp. TaxID=1917865 RepID=UPI0025FF00E1|nr:sugar transferase [Sediminibacterium sp.]MBW0177683.1 sugar transferase [Sediminibacterium sp.]